MGVRFPQETYYFIDASTFPAIEYKYIAKNLLSQAEEEIFFICFLLHHKSNQYFQIYFWTFADWNDMID